LLFTAATALLSSAFASCAVPNLAAGLAVAGADNSRAIVSATAEAGFIAMFRNLLSKTDSNVPETKTGYVKFLPGKD